ncbi:MAG: ParB/RepB/Spo0J family partition protein [Candidatus Coprovivens sp.]
MNLETGVLQVHVEDIIPNRFQPRLTFDEQGLKELSDSIKEHGIIQPLVLRKLGDKYEIIAGERRYKAAQMAGLTTVPAVIANIDDNKSAEVALVENIQRRDLTAIEEARSYKNLLDKGYLTQEQLAKRMGLSQPAIANKLRLLNLDEEVQQALLEEKISERHARTLLSLQDKAAQREWLHRIINERLTVRQLDLELKKIKSVPDSASNDEIIMVGAEEESSGEVPVVQGTPSLEEIKANAVDITKLNKNQNKPLVDNTMMEPLDTLESEINNNSNQLFNNPIVNDGNNFTTATTIPEFNIATPNSSSTFVPAENITNNNDASKFFSFDINNQQSPAAPVFTAPAGMTSNDNGLEIFDAPNEGNSFVTTNKEEEKTEFMNQTNQLPVKDEMINTDFELNPNNKFFTPATEKSQEITLEMQKDKIVDPMMAVDKLQTGYKESPTGQKRMDLKDAIANIRSCIESLGSNGFFIDVEEIDFDTNYQITMRIYKD